MRKSKTSVKVPKMDLCQTPGYGIEPFLSVVENLEGKRFWDCACGEGYLVDALEKVGMIGYSSDINPPYRKDDPISPSSDFLESDPFQESSFFFDYIVTNPPFSLKDKFTRHALMHKNNTPDVFGVALLMQTEVVSTKWFGEIVKDFGEPGIIWFNPRINFKMPEKGWEGSGSHFSTAWFTWGWFEGNRFVRMDHWTKEYRKRFEI